MLTCTSCKISNEFHLFEPKLAYILFLTDPNGSSLEIEQQVSKFHDYMDLAEVYNVYHRIYCFVEQPFTSHIPEALHNMARFLAHRIMKTTPPGVSKVYPYQTYTYMYDIHISDSDW